MVLVGILLQVGVFVEILLVVAVEVAVEVEADKVPVDEVVADGVVVVGTFERLHAGIPGDVIYFVVVNIVVQLREIEGIAFGDVGCNKIKYVVFTPIPRRSIPFTGYGRNLLCIIMEGRD